MADDTSSDSVRGHRPKTATVFVAAFVAGAVAAVVVNRALDLHLAQSRPQVESEPIFVALRPLPQGSPVTVWDVALRDWPCAMLPTSAIRAGDSFEGSVLKYPLREGQPLLAVQLMPASPPPMAAGDPGTPVEDAFVMPTPAAPPAPVAQPAIVAAQKPESKQDETAVTIASPVAPGTDVDPPAPAVAPKESISAATTAVTEPPPATVTESTTTPSRETADTEPTLAATRQQPTPVASDVESLLDIPSRPAVDLDSIPSVMARSESPAEPIEAGPKADPVRYLVVPERIARQADTSFVSPPAVEPAAEPAPPMPVVPIQPPAIKNPQAAAPRNTQATAPKSMKSAQSAPSKSAQSAPSKSPPTTARSNPQQRNNRGTNSSPQAMQQQRASKQPQEPGRQATKSQQNQASDRNVAEPSPRPWFPNISAGIEAVGNRWRGGGDEAVATDIPSGQSRK